MPSAAVKVETAYNLERIHGNTDFKPEYTGKLSFYISVVDDLVRDKAFDRPTIGVVLCKGKNTSVAEYALRDVNKPIGISTYRTEPLPQEVMQYLPSINVLEKELDTLSEQNRDTHP